MFPLIIAFYRCLTECAWQMFNAEEHNIITTNAPQWARKLLTMLSHNQTTLLNKYDCRLEHVTDIEDKLDIPSGG